MPEKATEEQRIEWHLEHVKYCACRPIPKGVIEIMKKKNITIPD